MQPRILSTQTLLVVILTGLALSLTLLSGSLPQSLNEVNGQVQKDLEPVENAVMIPKKEPISYGLPMRLKIPSISVDAAVEYVGLTPNKEMDVPKGPSGVAWFELGPRPGENGSAVLAGHYGRWKSGEGSVFDNLNKLKKGDKLYIEDDKGTTISFVVRESRSYDPNANAAEVFSSYDGNAHLSLITCEGVWNEGSQGYSNRLVVFADKE